MKEKLIELEKQLDSYSTQSKLKAETLSAFPENVRLIHSYRIFGSDLLAIPTNLIFEGDDEEFERPFTFLDSEEALNVFEREYREAIPEEFIQIGYLYGGTDLVVLNKIRNTVHIFHVQDVVDPKWLKRKLENEICTFEKLVDNLRPQTVCCFVNRKQYSQYDIFEIRNYLELKHDVTTTRFSDNDTLLAEYFKLVDNSLQNGYTVHYAPKRVLEKLNR